MSARRPSRSRVVVLAGVLAAALAGTSCAGGGPPTGGSHPSPPAAAPIRPTGGVHVDAGRLVAGGSRPVQLGGVSRSGTEYDCVHGGGVFVGPSGSASVAALASWHVDVVRLPLNEDCWLGINGVKPADGGRSYRTAIARYVHLLEGHGMVVDLDLHWSAPGTELASGQQRMADADHSPTFWRQVATMFGRDPSVMFELYNEPHDISWSCWEHGCMVPASDSAPAYRSAGMAQLVDTVRATGARNVLLLGGLGHAGDLSGWKAHEPSDPLHALAAAWHIYGGAGCDGPGCWQGTLNALHGAPVVVTELGEKDCAGGFVDRLMSWLDAHGVSYLAWAWTTWSGCGGPSLLTSYTGTPHGGYGATVRSHLSARFPSPVPG